METTDLKSLAVRAALAAHRRLSRPAPLLMSVTARARWTAGEPTPADLFDVDPAAGLKNLVSDRFPGAAARPARRSAVSLVTRDGEAPARSRIGPLRLPASSPAFRRGAAPPPAPTTEGTVRSLRASGAGMNRDASREEVAPSPVPTRPGRAGADRVSPPAARGSTRESIAVRRDRLRTVLREGTASDSTAPPRNRGTSGRAAPPRSRVLPEATRAESGDPGSPGVPREERPGGLSGVLPPTEPSVRREPAAAREAAPRERGAEDPIPPEPASRTSIDPSASPSERPGPIPIPEIAGEVSDPPPSPTGRPAAPRLDDAPTALREEAYRHGVDVS